VYSFREREMASARSEGVRRVGELNGRYVPPTLAMKQTVATAPSHCMRHMAAGLVRWLS